MGTSGHQVRRAAGELGTGRSPNETTGGGKREGLFRVRTMKSQQEEGRGEITTAWERKIKPWTDMTET